MHINIVDGFSVPNRASRLKVITRTYVSILETWSKRETPKTEYEDTSREFNSRATGSDPACKLRTKINKPTLDRAPDNQYDICAEVSEEVDLRHVEERYWRNGILRELCRQQGVELVEGYAMKDHIHMLLMIPPKFSWARGYCVSTVGLGEQMIRGT